MFKKSTADRSFGESRIARCLLAIHIAAVAFGATTLWEANADKLGPIPQIYGEVTGASHSYGFFAPRVASPSRVMAWVYLHNGEVIESNMDNLGREGAFRLSGYRDVNLDEQQAKAMKRLTSAQISARLFDKYPNAVRVKVQTQAKLIPKMSQVRSGEKSRWITLYECEFRKK